MAQAQKPLELILARNLLSSISTPAFLVDAEGTLVFFNEAGGSRRPARSGRASGGRRLARSTRTATRSPGTTSR